MHSQIAKSQISLRNVHGNSCYIFHKLTSLQADQSDFFLFCSWSVMLCIL